MKLLTKEIINRFKKIGSQENEKNPIVVAKFFNPSGAGTWWATEYDPVDKIFFGYVSIFGDHCDEWGSFSLEELENFKDFTGKIAKAKTKVTKEELLSFLSKNQKAALEDIMKEFGLKSSSPVQKCGGLRRLRKEAVV